MALESAEHINPNDAYNFEVKHVTTSCNVFLSLNSFKLLFLELITHYDIISCSTRSDASHQVHSVELAFKFISILFSVSIRISQHSRQYCQYVFKYNCNVNGKNLGIKLTLRFRHHRAQSFKQKIVS